MYGPKLFFCGFPKKQMFTNILLCLFVCASPNSITSPSFRCWSIPVTEICEFNRKKEKKKMNNSKSGYFQFYTFPSPNGPIFKSSFVFDGMVTRMPLEVQMNAH